MGTDMRVAAIDCGTNSIRLLIADIIGGDLRTVVRQMRIVRLGRGVDADGTLDQAAIDRTLEATREYRDVIERHGVSEIRFCATSAVRDAKNASDFADQVEAVLSMRPQVLTGAEEAECSYRGATRGLSGVIEPYTLTGVIDIGGGSTEIVTGVVESVQSRVSFDVGSVRMTERYLVSDPPTRDEVADCRASLRETLSQHAESLPLLRNLVGVAGTVTTVAAHVLQLSGYDGDAIHGARLPLDEVRAACAELTQMSVAERRALPFMHPGRADVIGAGALILDELVTALPLETSDLVVSESDILDGIAYAMGETLD